VNKDDVLYQQLFQTMPNGMAVIEAMDDGHGFCVRDCNDVMAYLLGMKRNELKGLIFSADLLPPLSDETLQQNLRRVCGTGEPQRYEKCYTGPDGTDVWLEHILYALPPTSIVILLNDITPQKRAEAGKEAQLHFLQQMLDSIPNPVFFKDLERRFRICNRAFINTMESSREHILGHTVFDLLDEKNAGLLDTINNLVLNEGRIVHMEHRITLKNNEERLLLVYEAPYYSSQGRLEGLVGNFVDITERKYIEEYQIEAEKLAERSLRLASLGTLAGGIAHEINQPLTVIKAEVDGIRIRKEMSQFITEEEVLDTMNVISEEVGRIHHIIEHMRSLIRGWPGGKMERVDLNATIRHALEIVGQQVGNHSIGLSLDLPQNLPDVLGNAPYIEQIVINLVVNAMQALDTCTRTDKLIIVRTRRYGNQLVIEVLDNGPGIPKEYIRNVFDPFFTTKQYIKSLGLGLAIVENFAQAMSGAIGAENIEGGGTLFRVVLQPAPGVSE